MSAARADGVEIVFVDTPPGTPAVLDEVVKLVDLALIPTAASPMDIDRVCPTLDLLADVPTAVVLNALDARETAASVAKENLEAAGVSVSHLVVEEILRPLVGEQGDVGVGELRHLLGYPPSSVLGVLRIWNRALRREPRVSPVVS